MGDVRKICEDREMKFVNLNKASYIAVFFALIASLVTAVAMAGHHGEGENKQVKKDIVETAIDAKNFTTLLAAVKQAELVGALKGEGPYTLFAPTDEAFAKIPESQLQALLNDKKMLASILTYHVVAGKIPSTDVVKLNTAKTLQGQSISIDTSNGVKVDNASVIMTDIVASNGVIHVIDTVIMPN
jgi:uncharacterized surface protein with fasciclin (FAS1) repeats